MKERCGYLITNNANNNLPYRLIRLTYYHVQNYGMYVNFLECKLFSCNKLSYNFLKERTINLRKDNTVLVEYGKNHCEKGAIAYFEQLLPFPVLFQDAEVEYE